MQKAKPSLCAILAASMLTFGMPMAEAGPREAHSAKTSVNRAGGAKAERPKVATNNNRGNNMGSNNRSSANKVNANNNKVGNKTNINNSKHNNVNVKNNNVNVNRDVNIDVDGHGHGYYYDDNDWNIGQAMVTTAAVVATAAVIGSIVTPNQLPSNCVQVINGGVTYMQCGTTWYQPQYQGSNVTYIVVNQPY